MPVDTIGVLRLSVKRLRLPDVVVRRIRDAVIMRYRLAVGIARRIEEAEGEQRSVAHRRRGRDHRSVRSSKLIARIVSPLRRCISEVRLLRVVPKHWDVTLKQTRRL